MCYVCVSMCAPHHGSFMYVSRSKQLHENMKKKKYVFALYIFLFFAKKNKIN